MDDIIGDSGCEELRIHLIAKTQRRATTKERRTPGNILQESQHIRGGGILFQAKPNKEKKHQQRKTNKKEKSTNKGKVKRKEKYKPRSKNHQDAARSATSLSPSVWSPSALLIIEIDIKQINQM